MIVLIVIATLIVLAGGMSGLHRLYDHPPPQKDQEPLKRDR